MKIKELARDRAIRQAAELAANAFAEHVIECKHAEGLYRHYRCGKPSGACEYHFQIVTFPGRLVVSGDIGDLMLARMPDMFGWAPSAVNSIDYFAQKVIAGRVKEYDGDVLREAIEDVIEQDDAEDPSIVSFLNGRELTEQKAVDIARELLADVDFSNPHEALMAVYESGLFDGGDFPSSDNYTGNFLWCREAVRWFFANHKQGKT